MTSCPLIKWRGQTGEVLVLAMSIGRGVKIATGSGKSFAAVKVKGGHRKRTTKGEGISAHQIIKQKSSR